MTKEQFKKLVKYEQIFRTAIDARYIRSMDSRFAADFIDVCRELNVYINPSCPQCVLNAATVLGNLYFNQKEENKAQEAKKAKDKETNTKENKAKQAATKDTKKPKSK